MGVRVFWGLVYGVGGWGWGLGLGVNNFILPGKCSSFYACGVGPGGNELGVTGLGKGLAWGLGLGVMVWGLVLGVRVRR